MGLQYVFLCRVSIKSYQLYVCRVKINNGALFLNSRAHNNFYNIILPVQLDVNPANIVNYIAAIIFYVLKLALVFHNFHMQYIQVAPY